MFYFIEFTKQVEESRGPFGTLDHSPESLSQEAVNHKI